MFNPSDPSVGLNRAAALGTAPFPVLATVHLRLRPFALSDITSLKKIMQDPHGIETSSDLRSTFRGEQLRLWIESHAKAWTERRAMHWAVSPLTRDSLIGYVGIQDIDAVGRQVELNVLMGRAIQRQGYVIEAIEATLAFAFTDLELEWVCADCPGEEVAMQRMLKTIGMKHKASADSEMDGLGLYVISKPEWVASL